MLIVRKSLDYARFWEEPSPAPGLYWSPGWAPCGIDFKIFQNGDSHVTKILL